MKNLHLEHLALELYRQPWAIMPEKLTALINVFENRRAGLTIDEKAVEAVKAERAKATAARGQWRDLECGLSAQLAGRVAILPLHGVIVQRPGVFTRYSGGCSVEQFVAGHAELINDPGVKAVVWDVHSPGGSVYGVEEGFRRLYAMRGKKKTVAFSNTVMCSAAYYLASAADEITASPSSVSGNIGVVQTHEDWTKKNEMEGVKVTYITAGKYKAEGWPDLPLSDEAKAAMQADIDAYYDQFVAAVAAGRGVPESKVRTGMGEGRALTSQFALAAGLVDNISTIEAVLEKLGAYERPATAAKVTAETRIRIAHAHGS